MNNNKAIITKIFDKKNLIALLEESEFPIEMILYFLLNTRIIAKINNIAIKTNEKILYFSGTKAKAHNKALPIICVNNDGLIDL